MAVFSHLAGDDELEGGELVEGRPKLRLASSVCHGRQAGSAAIRLASSDRSTAIFSRCVKPVAGSRSSNSAARLAPVEASSMMARANLNILLLYTVYDCRSDLCSVAILVPRPLPSGLRGVSDRSWSPLRAVIGL